jgi:hypothetical protein
VTLPQEMPDGFTPDRVALADAIAVGILPTWTEGVAVIRAIASDLDRSAPPLLVPDLSQVFILPAGQVKIEGGRADPRGAVAGLGKLLQTVLERSSPPAALAAVAQHAQTQPPAYASLPELQDALSFFERPDPTGELAGYFNRAARALETVARPVSVDPELPSEPPADRPLEVWEDQPARARRWWVPMLAGAAVLAMGGVVWTYQADIWRWLAGPGQPGAQSSDTAGSTGTQGPPAPRGERSGTPRAGSSPARPSPQAAPKPPPGNSRVPAPSRSAPPASTDTPTGTAKPEAVERPNVPPAAESATPSPRVTLPETPAPMAKTDRQAVPFLEAIV